MLNEKEIIAVLVTVTTQLKDAVTDRDYYKELWLKTNEKVTEYNATIANQHAELVRVNGELTELRETGTIVVHDHAVKEEV